MKPLCIIFASSILSLHHYQHFTIMTSINLNQELFRQLSLIAGDEKLMRKTIEAIKLIVKQENEQSTTEMILASPEMMKILREGDEQIARGDVTPIKLEELWK